MGPGLISLLFAIGGGAWVYSKMQRRTGGLARESLIVSTMCGLLIFLGAFIILRVIL